jgi:starvation-inducible DNA-binding protein
MNEQLVNALKVLLADTIALKFKAHGFHWNVETDDFPQYHAFFGSIYEDFNEAVDPFAEWIRMLDNNQYAPFSLSRLASLTTVPDAQVTPDHESMAADLLASIELITPKIVEAAVVATAANQFGLANFLGDRQTAHQKWIWQLKTVVKPEPMDVQETEQGA